MIEFFDVYSHSQLLVLIGGAFIAGILNAISGGGGMVLIPLMVLTGIPPINAIAINKFQNTIGSLAAICHYRSIGLFSLHTEKYLFLMASIGAASGVLVLKKLSETDALLNILPYLLIAIALYSVLPSDYSRASSSHLGESAAITPIWALVGLYGGLIGLGTGPLMIAIDRFFYGSELRQAIARTKPIMFVINIVSLSILMWMGFLWWKIAILLAFSNLLGAKLGACIVTSSMLRIAQAIVFLVPVVAAAKLLLTAD